MCSLAAGYGEPFASVHIYYSCHSLLLAVSPTLSFHHSPWLPVAVSLFISSSVTNLHHLLVSNLPFFPSLSLFIRCRSLSLSFFIHPHRLPLTLPSLPLPLCLCYFVWLTSVIARLPLVFCFVYVVSLGLLSCSSKGMNPHICQPVVEDTLQLLFPQAIRPANLHIHECTHPHRHAFAGILHATGYTILNSQMLLIFCFYPVHEQMNTLLWFIWNTVCDFEHINSKRWPSSAVQVPFSVSFVCQKV